MGVSMLTGFSKGKEDIQATARRESGIDSCEAVKIAFNYEDGDIVIEANSAAEICNVVEDIVH